MLSDKETECTLLVSDFYPSLCFSGLGRTPRLLLNMHGLLLLFGQLIYMTRIMIYHEI